MNTKRAKAMGQCAAVALAAALSGFASDAEADGELALRVDGSRVRLSYSLPFSPARNSASSACGSASVG